MTEASKIAFERLTAFSEEQERLSLQRLRDVLSDGISIAKDGQCIAPEEFYIMPEEAPNATEETGHIWIKTENGAVNLTAEVGWLIRVHAEPNSSLDTNADGVAATILAHPIIKAALDQYSRTVVPSADVGEMQK